VPSKETDRYIRNGRSDYQRCRSAYFYLAAVWIRRRPSTVRRRRVRPGYASLVYHIPMLTEITDPSIYDPLRYSRPAFWHKMQGVTRATCAVSSARVLGGAHVPCVLWGHCSLIVHDVPTIVSVRRWTSPLPAAELPRANRNSRLSTLWLWMTTWCAAHRR